jgi:hypothetical protein
MDLRKRWSFEECTDRNLLFEKLDSLLDDGKIYYQENDGFTIDITDLELTEDEELGLDSFMTEIDVYQTEIEKDLNVDYYLEDFEYDDYHIQKKNPWQ